MAEPILHSIGDLWLIQCAMTLNRMIDNIYYGYQTR